MFTLAMLSMAKREHLSPTISPLLADMSILCHHRHEPQATYMSATVADIEGLAVQQIDQTVFLSGRSTRWVAAPLRRHGARGAQPAPLGDSRQGDESVMAPDTLPRKAMTLERVLLAAASAIASALATFSFLTWRKRQKARPPHVAHMASADGQAP